MAAQACAVMRLGAVSRGVAGETVGTFILGLARQELEQKCDVGALWGKQFNSSAPIALAIWRANCCTERTR